MGSTWQSYSLTGLIGENLAIFGVGNAILIGSKGIYISEDGGRTWGSRSVGLGADRLELRQDQNFGWRLWLQEGMCLSNGDHPLYRSPDGQSWEQVTAVSCDITFDGAGTIYYRTGVRSEDRGQNWMVMETPQDLITIIAPPFSTGDVYATAYSGATLKSIDYGLTWKLIFESNTGRYPRLFFDSKGEVFYANASYRVTDAGKTWTQCGNNISTTMADQVIAIDPREKNHLFAATSGSGIMVSTDGCLNWNTLPGTDDLTVNGLSIDPNNPDTIYAASDSGAFVSFDNGNHWNQINAGLLETPVVYSIISSQKSGIFASTPYGVFKLESNK